MNEKWSNLFWIHYQLWIGSVHSSTLGGYSGGCREEKDIYIYGRLSKFEMLTELKCIF